jgi:hypothetical protein
MHFATEFAAMSAPELHTWIYPLVDKLLRHDRRILSLLAHNPFPHGPPKFIRIDLYLYQFTKPGERAWWKRRFLSQYLPPAGLR